MTSNQGSNSLKAAISTAIVNNSLAGGPGSTASYVKRVATYYNMRKKRDSTTGRPYSPRRPWCESLREGDGWPSYVRSSSTAGRANKSLLESNKKKKSHSSKQLTLLVTSKFIDLGFFRRVIVDCFLRSSYLP